jgi:WD40 repeat protein
LFLCCSVASGTIFNDVLLWLVPRAAGADAVAPVARLSGHEGSVHRLVWSPCGARLCSVSDDRTARVWAVAPSVWSPPDAAGTPPAALTPALSLFGHTGRVWDARFVVPTDGDGGNGDELLATVSEDCTVRLWRLPDGAPRGALAGHRGRGIWRCALAGGSLATGGADGGVKLWRLADWLARGSAPAGAADASGTETLALPEPPAPALVAALPGAPDEPRAKVKDSSSECVRRCSCAEAVLSCHRLPLTRALPVWPRRFCRCVAAASPQLLLLATNLGLVRAAHLPPTSSASASAPRWSPPLYATPHATPLMCMRVAPRAAWPPAGSNAADGSLVARVLLGDMSGGATLLDVLLLSAADADDDALAAGFHGRVVAHWEAHPLGRTLGAFWLDVGGGEMLPATADAMGSLKLWRCGDDGGAATAQLVADTQVAHRVLCASAAPHGEGGAAFAAILCGDQRGDVSAFGLQRCADGQAWQLRSLGVVRRAHAATAVTFAHCTVRELVTAGGDGYMCTFALQAPADDAPADAPPLLVRTGRHHVAAITAIETLHEDGESGGACGAATVAAGVTANDIVLWDLRNACELLRVPCGGWRRPHACALGDGGRFVVAFVSKGVLHVRRRWPEDALAGDDDDGALQLVSGPHAHRSLRAGHHGREVHTSLFVPPPEDGAAAASTCCALLTGSEDGTLFHVYFDAADAGAPALPRLRASSLLAQTTGGTAVRAIALVPHPSGGWFLLSAGAKEVLMCWRLTWQGASLAARNVSAQARPADAFHRAWRAGAAAPADATGGDQRHLAVCGFVAGDRLYAAVSSSDATLAVWTLPVSASGGARWSLCATLRVGHCPVLCLSCVAALDGHWLLGGATDGTVRVWQLGALPQQAAADAATGMESPSVPEVMPAALLRGMHQSGVNSLSVAAAPAPLATALGATQQPLWVLVTGGDDQALNALVVQLSLTGGVRVVAAQRRPDAHASALKAVWTDGTAVLTTSLDQRLRTWYVCVCACSAKYGFGCMHLS